jgi:riboflavin biosynthesis pyrimidine reductase
LSIEIINVMASSVDGFVAVHGGQSDDERMAQGFTGSEDREHLEDLIRSADAIVLGSQTLIASGGVLDVPKNDGGYPLWVTFTNRGIPENHAFWSQRYASRWLVSKERLEGTELLDETEPSHNRNTSKPQNVVYGQKDAVEVCISILEKAGCKRVLLFGGGEINRMFYAAGRVNELILTLCPVIVARESAVPIVNGDLDKLINMKLRTVKPAGNLIFLHYDIL